jgi:signal transduction histidine kinase
MMDTVTQGLQSVKGTLTGATNQLANGVAEGLQNTVVASFQDWLAVHPIVAWMVHHPIAALFLLAVVIILFWGLIRAIAQLTERIWISLLQVPLKLSLWFWKWVSRPLKHMKLIQSSAPTATPPATTQTQLVEILARLEALSQEQSQLMKEFRTLVSRQNIKIDDVNESPTQTVR